MTKEYHVPIVQAEQVSQSNTDEYPIVGIIPSDKKIRSPDMDRSVQGDRTTNCCDDCCEGCCSNENNDDIWLCCCLLCFLNHN
jgi:hypothetical protein